MAHSRVVRVSNPTPMGRARREEKGYEKREEDKWISKAIVALLIISLEGFFSSLLSETVSTRFSQLLFILFALRDIFGALWCENTLSSDRARSVHGVCRCEFAQECTQLV